MPTTILRVNQSIMLFLLFLIPFSEANVCIPECNLPVQSLCYKLVLPYRLDAIDLRDLKGTNCSFTGPEVCKKYGAFLCDENEDYCFMNVQRCDGFPDCENGADEKDCEEIVQIEMKEKKVSHMQGVDPDFAHQEFYNYRDEECPEDESELFCSYRKLFRTFYNCDYPQIY